MGHARRKTCVIGYVSYVFARFRSSAYYVEINFVVVAVPIVSFGAERRRTVVDEFYVAVGIFVFPHNRADCAFFNGENLFRARKGEVCVSYIRAVKRCVSFMRADRRGCARNLKGYGNLCAVDCEFERCRGSVGVAVRREFEIVCGSSAVYSRPDNVVGVDCHFLNGEILRCAVKDNEVSAVRFRVCGIRACVHVFYYGFKVALKSVCSARYGYGRTLRQTVIGVFEVRSGSSAVYSRPLNGYFARSYFKHTIRVRVVYFVVAGKYICVVYARVRHSSAYRQYVVGCGVGGVISRSVGDSARFGSVRLSVVNPVFCVCTAIGKRVSVEHPFNVRFACFKL